MQVANRIIKNTLFLYLKMFITVFSSLYTTRLVLNALGANDFGIFNLVAGLISMLIFLNVAMTKASLRFMSYHKGKNSLLEQKSIFNISILLHLIIAFLVVCFLEILINVLFGSLLKIDANRIEVAKQIYHFAVISTFITIISVPLDAVINANEDMRFVAILGIFESLLKLGVAFIVVIVDVDKLFLYGLLVVVVIFINFLIKVIYCYKKYEEVEINIRKYFEIKLFKKMLHFASYTFLGSFASIVNNYGQAPLLNMFFGTVVNAAQGIVGQASGQLGAFAVTMLKALNPIIDKSEGSGNRQMMLKTSFAGAKFGSFLLILFYIPMFFEMKTVLVFWLVNVPPFTFIFFKLLLIRNLIEQSYRTLSSSIAATGNIKTYQIYSSILTVFPLLISYYLFQIGYKPFVLYIVNICYSIINGGLILYFTKKVCGLSIMDYFRQVIFKVILSGVFITIFVFIFYYIFQENEYRWIVTFLSSFFSFLFVVYTVGLTTIERNFITNLVRRKINIIRKD